MKRTVTILGGDERMAWLAESLRREGYIIRLAALLYSLGGTASAAPSSACAAPTP